LNERFKRKSELIKKIMESAEFKIALIGAGHAHLQALSMFAKEKLPSHAKIYLISEYPFTFYYGKLPGTIASK
jgi:NADH dehydrogenase FAD-containing subunit